jgi:hypothetical protein
MKISTKSRFILTVLALTLGASSLPAATIARREKGVSDLYTCSSLSSRLTADERALLRLVREHLRVEGLGPLLPGERCMVKAAATGDSIWLGNTTNADDPPDNDPAVWAPLRRCPFRCWN